MPKLWSETIQAHRREVGEAILDTTLALVTRLGLRAVTMSRIAEETGIGRATLYKYFPNVESILVAWHDRHIKAHLDQLMQLGDQSASPRQRLERVLGAYARLLSSSGGGHSPELLAILHQGDTIARARQRLHAFLRGLLAEGAASGEVRQDVAPDELASYCLHALEAASSLGSEAALQRLVAVTLAGLRP